MSKEAGRDNVLLWDWFFMGFCVTSGAIVGLLGFIIVMLCILDVRGWLS